MINSWIQWSLFAVAWSVALFKFGGIWQKRVWKTDRYALILWLGMLFFAITMTFLVESVAVAFDALTWNNLSRLIAYASISLALFFITASSLFTLKTPQGMQIFRLLIPFLITTLLSLTIIYALSISRAPEWQDHHVPRNLAEALFMFSMYSFSFLLCFVLAWQYIGYLSQEKVGLMRIRVWMSAMTALIAGAYFFVKIALVGGYFWEPLSSELIIALSKVLLILSAFMWAIAFVNNKLYLKGVGWLKSLSNWLALKDLEYLLYRLDLLCPPVALTDEKPSFKNFLHNSEYHLYRAIIRILDGKTLLADFLNSDGSQNQPDWWDSGLLQEAEQINRALASVRASNDFWEIVQSFRMASKQLLRYGHSRDQEAIMG